MNTFTIFLILIVIVAFLLVVSIMVQDPKGGGVSSTFGGGSSQQMGGVKKTTDFLDKSTWVLATILLALILLSNVTIMGDAPQSKIIGGDKPQQMEIPAQKDAPALPSETPSQPESSETK